MHTLESRTLDFWNLSSAHNGKASQLSPRLNTVQAINICDTQLDNLGPHRKLAARFATLQSAIISGGRKTKSKTPATVLQLVRRQA